MMKKAYQHNSTSTVEKTHDYNIFSNPENCEKVNVYSHPIDSIYNSKLRSVPYNTLYGKDTSRYFKGTNIKSQHQRMLYPQFSNSPVREIEWEKSDVKPINPFDYTNELTVAQIKSRQDKYPSNNAYFSDKSNTYFANGTQPNRYLKLSTLILNSKTY